MNTLTPEQLPIFVYFKEVQPGWPEFNTIDEFSCGERGGEPLVKLSDVRALLAQTADKDAERYRFIRSQMETGAVTTMLPLYRVLYWVGYEPCDNLLDADAAVDAAIAQQSGKEGA